MYQTDFSIAFHQVRAPYEPIGLAVVVKCYLVASDARVVEVELDQVRERLENGNVAGDARAGEVEFGQVRERLEDGNVTHNIRVVEGE